MTTQNYIASAMKIGLSAAELEMMTVGMVMDVMSEFIPAEDAVRVATQEDIDRML